MYKEKSNLWYYLDDKMPLEKIKRYLMANVFQRGEIQKNVDTLREFGHDLKSLGLKIEAIHLSEFIGIYPNKITYVNYIYKER